MKVYKFPENDFGIETIDINEIANSISLSHGDFYVYRIMSDGVYRDYNNKCLFYTELKERKFSYKDYPFKGSVYKFPDNPLGYNIIEILNPSSISLYNITGQRFDLQNISGTYFISTDIL